MYLAHTPEVVQRLFSDCTWRGAPQGRRVYLTFDDGPIPEVTPWVLDTLAAAGATATFFCVGENVARYPDLLSRVIAEGHSVGNHTYNHLSGWTTERADYVANVAQCARLVDSRLFRPPYGRISPRKATLLRERYDIVMWDVLSGDFDAETSPEECLANVLEHVSPGSIVVFHDSVKSEHNLRYVLPRALDSLGAAGYRFAGL